MSQLPRISEAELTVMKLLWEADGPLATADICEALSERMRWDRSTVRTLLKRLTDKGAISEERLPGVRYRPLVEERDYVEEQTKRFVDTLYSGSAARLVASLVRTKGLTEHDMEELRGFFNKEKEGL